MELTGRSMILLFTAKVKHDSHSLTGVTLIGFTVAINLSIVPVNFELQLPIFKPLKFSTINQDMARYKILFFHILGKNHKRTE